MTYFLTQEPRNIGAAATYRDIMDNVKDKMNALHPAQNPQLEGVNIDQFVFGDLNSVAQHYILASPLQVKNIKLAAGKVQGLWVGSVFEVYKPGTKKFEEPGKSIARVNLTRVTSFNSEGEIIDGKQIPEFSRAIECEHQFPDPRLYIYYKGLSESKTLQMIKAELDQYNYIETLPEASGYHLLLRQSGNEIVTEGGDTTEISPWIPTSDPDAVKRVVDQVIQWVRWFNILSIINPAPALDIKFTITVIREGQSHDPFEHVGKAEAVFNEGEQFECIIENKSCLKLYIAILDLSTDGSLSLTYPSIPGAAELLPPGSSWTIPAETFLSEGRESVKAILKVFATTPPVDFHFLTQPHVRGAETRSVPKTMRDPLGELLANATLGTKRGARPVRLDNWVTAQSVLEFKKLIR